MADGCAEGFWIETIDRGGVENRRNVLCFNNIHNLERTNNLHGTYKDQANI